MNYCYLSDYAVKCILLKDADRVRFFNDDAHEDLWREVKDLQKQIFAARKDYATLCELNPNMKRAYDREMDELIGVFGGRANRLLSRLSAYDNPEKDDEP